MLETGDVIFVDARSPKAWREGHTKVPGAMRVPVEQVTLHAASLPKTRTIVIYCTCEGEESSTNVAEQLRQLGHQDVRILDGGYTAWKAAGLPTESVHAATEVVGEITG